MNLGRTSTQIRVRLRPEERHTYEQLRLQDWQVGHAYAETLSSWVRYQLTPLTTPRPHSQLCHISKELKDNVARIAKLIGKEPEEFIEDCIEAITDMSQHSKRKRHPLIAQYHKLLAVSQKQNQADAPPNSHATLG